MNQTNEQALYYPPTRNRETAGAPPFSSLESNSSFGRDYNGYEGQSNSIVRSWWSPSYPIGQGLSSTINTPTIVRALQPNHQSSFHAPLNWKDNVLEELIQRQALTVGIDRSEYNEQQDPQQPTEEAGYKACVSQEEVQDYLHSSRGQGPWAVPSRLPVSITLQTEASSVSERPSSSLQALEALVASQEVPDPSQNLHSIENEASVVSPGSAKRGRMDRKRGEDKKDFDEGAPISKKRSSSPEKRRKCVKELLELPANLKGIYTSQVKMDRVVEGSGQSVAFEDRYLYSWRLATDQDQNSNDPDYHRASGRALRRLILDNDYKNFFSVNSVLPFEIWPIFLFKLIYRMIPLWAKSALCGNPLLFQLPSPRHRQCRIKGDIRDIRIFFDFQDFCSFVYLERRLFKSLVPVGKHTQEEFHRHWTMFRDTCRPYNSMGDLKRSVRDYAEDKRRADTLYFPSGPPLKFTAEFMQLLSNMPTFTMPAQPNLFFISASVEQFIKIWGKCQTNHGLVYSLPEHPMQRALGVTSLHLSQLPVLLIKHIDFSISYPSTFNPIPESGCFGN